jgi:hypothetical protein
MRSINKYSSVILICGFIIGYILNKYVNQRGIIYGLSLPPANITSEQPYSPYIRIEANVHVDREKSLPDPITECSKMVPVRLLNAW